MIQVTPDVSEGDGDSGDTSRREMVIQVTPDVSEGDGESGDTSRREMVIQVIPVGGRW